MLSAIRRYFALCAIRRAIRLHPRQKAFPVLSDVRRVLLFCTNSDNEIRALVADFEREGKTVEVWAYNPTANYTEQKMSCNRFGSQNTNLIGLPKKNIVEDFEGKEYDLVIDLTLAEELPLQYLLALSEAPFKVGAKKSFADNYDLMIESNEIFSEQELLAQITYYLSQIRPKKD